MLEVEAKERTKNSQGEKARKFGMEEATKEGKEGMRRYMEETTGALAKLLKGQEEIKENLVGEVKKLTERLEIQQKVIDTLLERVEAMEKRMEEQEEGGKWKGTFSTEKTNMEGGGSGKGEGSGGGGDNMVRDDQDKWEKVVEAKLQERESMMRRKCQVRITGIEEKVGERPLELRRKVEDLFEDIMKVKGSGAMMVDVFRVGKKGEDKWGRPRVIIARMGSEGQRNLVLKGKPNLRDYRTIGVDIDRTREEVARMREEANKRREQNTQSMEEKKGREEQVKADQEREERVRHEEVEMYEDEQEEESEEEDEAYDPRMMEEDKVGGRGKVGRGKYKKIDKKGKGKKKDSSDNEESRKEEERNNTRRRKSTRVRGGGST